MKFNIVICDPPFVFADKLKMSDVKRSSGSNYDTMTLQQIKDIPINKITDKESLLALWVPSTLLQDGLDIMKLWNFSYRQMWIWVKLKKDPFKILRNEKDIKWDQIKFEDFLSFGMGHIGRNVHEICLIGTKGKIYKHIKNKSQRTVFFYQNTRHSQKPEILQDKLDLIFPGQDLNRLEIFGRRLRTNWTVLGNQSPSCIGEDVYDSIIRLESL